MKIRFSDLELSDGTHTYKAIISGADASQLHSIASLIAEHYRVIGKECVISLEANTAQEAKQKYNNISLAFRFASNHQAEIIQMIDKGYTLAQMQQMSDADISNILAPTEPTQEKPKKHKTLAQKKAQAQYMQGIDEIKIRMPKGKKADIQKKAAEKGMSVNAYILSLIDADLP